jgi:hypothetical protein
MDIAVHAERPLPLGIRLLYSLVLEPKAGNALDCNLARIEYDEV